MKRIIIGAGLLFAVHVYGASPFTLSFTTVDYGSNENILAGYITQGATYINTIGVYGQTVSYLKDLSSWKAASGISLYTSVDADAYMGATRTTFSNPNPVVFVWDLQDKNGVVVPDGTYTVNLEIVNMNQGRQFYSFDFVKDSVAGTRTVANSTYFTGISIAYVPLGPANTVPVAQTQSVTTAEDTAKAITLMATDAESNTLTYAIATNPSHGTLSGTPPSVTYAPATNYYGADSFTFTASDASLTSTPATVSITVTPVNDAPVANNQSVTTPEDTATNLVLTATDVDSSNLTYSILAGPVHGTLSGLNTNSGAVTYTPTNNYNGSDSFTFRAFDGSLYATGTVSLTVTPVNDAPVANNQSVTTPEDTATNLVLTATDVDSSNLTYSILAGPVHGTLSGLNTNSGAVTYTPTNNYNGSDSFTFRAFDGSLYATGTVSLTVTHMDYYALTVTGGTGGGSYTNGRQVAISANAPAAGKTFNQWIGDTQYVNNVTYTNAIVTMPTNAVSLSATYKNLPGYYTLTVSNGTGGGAYSNGVKVAVTAVPPNGTAFNRWTGDTQVISGPFSLNTIVTMPAQDAALAAACVAVTNGVASAAWGATAGFYFSADPNTGILGPVGSGKSTLAQLMYSPDNTKDSILASGAGAVNDVVWDTVTITENGDGITEWATFSASTIRAFTNGYVYALIFQDNNVQTGDWYYSTPLLALQKLDTNSSLQKIEMNTDTLYGDPINGAYGAQVVGSAPAGVVLTSSAGAGGAASPANTNVLSGSSATFLITASNYCRIASLTTNGTAVTGMTFNNNSTTTNFTWSNVQTSGVLAASFTNRVATNAPAPVPYSWLASYGLTNSGATFDQAAVADQDGDGLTAWQEYIAGTDPTNAASCFKAAQSAPDKVSWSAVSGRVYSVYWSTNLTQGFQALNTNIFYPQGSYTNASPDPRVNHYQIKVRLQ